MVSAAATLSGAKSLGAGLFTDGAGATVVAAAVVGGEPVGEAEPDEHLVVEEGADVRDPVAV